VIDGFAIRMLDDGKFPANFRVDLGLNLVRGAAEKPLLDDDGVEPGVEYAVGGTSNARLTRTSAT
jgi:hypothetical protein